MRFSHILSWVPFFIFAFGAMSVACADGSRISGVVRDGDSKPLSDVRITLAGRQAPGKTTQTITGPSGEYRFTGLAVGEYTISAELSGYALDVPLLVHILPASILVTVDLTMIKTSAPIPVAAAPSHPLLEFQTAGIRGLIDPGGYSASTSTAATGLLRGIADVKRTDKSFGTSAAKDWPCGLEQELRKAAAEGSDQAKANRRLGQFYVAHGQPAKAIPALRRALQIDATDHAASRELAVAWLESGDFENARKLLTPLAELHAESEVHQLLARADEGSGMFLQAAQQYLIADNQEPSEESRFGVGYELILAGSVADSFAAFEAGVQRYPRSIPLLIGAGTAQFLLGKTSDGLRRFLDATEIDPADSRPYSFLANASGVRREQNERVRNSFKRFVDRKPNSAIANYFYALALSRESAVADASHIEMLLKRAIQLDPNLSEAHLQLADIYAQRDDYADAVPEYEAAVRLAQDLGEAHYRLAMAYKRTGHADLGAREMQIFRLSRKQQASGSERIDLAQFISVMDTPDRQASQEIQCPDASR